MSLYMVTSPQLGQLKIAPFSLGCIIFPQLEHRGGSTSSLKLSLMDINILPDVNGELGNIKSD
jgi:hypothetical protein